METYTIADLGREFSGSERFRVEHPLSLWYEAFYQTPTGNF